MSARGLWRRLLGHRSDPAPDVQALYRRHAGFIMCRALRFLPDAAEADAVVHGILERFIDEPHLLQDLPSPSTWLYAEATRLCIERLRGQRRRGEPITLAPELPGLRPSAARDRYATALLNRLIERSDDGTLTLVIHAFVDGMTAPEIGRITGVDPARVGSRITALGRPPEPAAPPDHPPGDGFGDLFDRGGHLTSLTIGRLLAGELAVDPTASDDRITGPLVVHLTVCAPCRDALASARAFDARSRPDASR